MRGQQYPRPQTFGSLGVADDDWRGEVRGTVSTSQLGPYQSGGAMLEDIDLDALLSGDARRMRPVKEEMDLHGRDRSMAGSNSHSHFAFASAPLPETQQRAALPPWHPTSELYQDRSMQRARGRLEQPTSAPEHTIASSLPSPLADPSIGGSSDQDYPMTSELSSQRPQSPTGRDLKHFALGTSLKRPRRPQPAGRFGSAPELASSASAPGEGAQSSPPHECGSGGQDGASGPESLQALQEAHAHMLALGCEAFVGIFEQRGTVTGAWQNVSENAFMPSPSVRRVRVVATDPRLSPDITPQKAARILANRASAARSKEKHRLASASAKAAMKCAAFKLEACSREIDLLKQAIGKFETENAALEENVRTLQQELESLGAYEAGQAGARQAGGDPHRGLGTYV